MMLPQISLKVFSCSWLLVFVCVLTFVSNGDAIKCFVCDSSDNPSCADLKSNSSIVPEECSLDKMKSIDTWLFELNKISYFDTGASKSPLMNCQKVVAKDPETNKMVTARFCQLDTGDSDACSILRTKLRLPPPVDEKTKAADAKKGKQNNEKEFHCSICNTDRCNGSERFSRMATGLTGSGFFVALVLLIMQQQHQQQRIIW